MIKYLLLIAIVFVVLSLMRGGRSFTRPREDKRASPAPTPVPAPQDMIECPVCHVHLPRADALPGPDGQLYCCVEHRTRKGA
ncbi:MAG TPA: PP0621 family protein [Ramlibacter sp.]|nr:PP0621 family protein [Ramlibacter sp.]